MKPADRTVTLWQLLQWRAAIRCEAAGMRHSSGRSCRKFAALALGLPARTPHAQLIGAITEIIEQARGEVSR